MTAPPVITAEQAERLFGITRESFFTMSGRRVSLRPAMPGDIGAACLLHCVPELRAPIAGGGPLSPTQAAEWLDGMIRSQEAKLFAIHSKARGRAVGFLWVDALFHARGCWSVALTESVPHGYGAEATALGVQYAFQREGLHRVSVAVAEHNRLSRRHVMRLGFREEGRYREACCAAGVRYDLILYGLLDREATYLPVGVT
jgi:RimJ/RimL family protein N-acetyltransferase